MQENEPVSIEQLERDRMTGEGGPEPELVEIRRKSEEYSWDALQRFAAAHRADGALTPAA
jgi:hypothetical protein